MLLPLSPFLGRWLSELWVWQWQFPWVQPSWWPVSLYPNSTLSSSAQNGMWGRAWCPHLDQYITQLQHQEQQLKLHPRFRINKFKWQIYKMLTICHLTKFQNQLQIRPHRVTVCVFKISLAYSCMRFANGKNSQFQYFEHPKTWAFSKNRLDLFKFPAPFHFPAFSNPQNDWTRAPKMSLFR